MKKQTKIIKCLKCHEDFKTELDAKGIPYNKLCYKCRRSNKKNAHGYKTCSLGR